MNKLKKIIERELAGWKNWQVAWMVFATVMILGISIYQKDPFIGIGASITGVICVILCGMGKVSNYFFGTINVILYAIMAWKAKYYGDVMLNLLYYLPTNIIGWVLWEKNVNSSTQAVYKKRMTIKQDVALAIVSVVSVFGYAYILKLLGGNLPLADSMSTVFSVIAQILMIKRFMEQWIIWIVVDVVSVIMWVFALFTEGASVAVLLMWSVFLINAIIMFVLWYKDTKAQNSGKVIEGEKYDVQ